MSEPQNISFKHYTLFRKAVMNKRTGTLAFITHLGFAGRIPFVEGRLVNWTDRRLLTHFFDQPLQQVHWDESSLEEEGVVDAPLMLAPLFESLQWSEAYAEALRDMFSKLPPVQVESIPLEFEDYHIEICASLLHRQSLTKEDFRPADFFSGVNNPETLHVRLKVVLLTYVCGLMKPRAAHVSKPTRSANHAAASSGIVSRIFQRIKRIGTS